MHRLADETPYFFHQIEGADPLEHHGLEKREGTEV
jgi:hypothetical protein